MKTDKRSEPIKMDERNYVEKPFLDQLESMNWEIIDLDLKQHPSDSFRQSFTDVVMLPVLKEQIKTINPWIEDDQVEEVVKQLTANFTGTGLLSNKYTMRQAIEDGVTLEIVYEGRTHHAEITDQSGMDATFEDVFSEYNLEERMELLGCGSRDAYLEAEPTTMTKAQDMVKHYLTHVYPNGYKAQIVATSREAAVRYKTHIDKALKNAISELETSNPGKLALEQLKRLKTDVIISRKHNNPLYLKAYTDKSKHEATIKSFKIRFGTTEEGTTGDMGIVIVNNMLLTGFDAPVEQVMYLDKVIVAHNFLQAIARVNRVGGEGKDKGFIVDYVGIGHHLKRALDNYDEREQKEVIDTLRFPEDERKELLASHTAMMEFLNKLGLTDLNDHDAFFDLFYDEDIRFDFMLAFKRLTRCLNLLLPSRYAFDYLQDYKALTEINILAGKHFRDGRLSMKGIPQKLRSITESYLESKGVEIKVEPISILDENFQKQVANRSRTKTKSAEVEHAIRHHLAVELNDDPDLQASFSEALTALFVAFKDNWDKIYEELETLRKRIVNSGKEPAYGLHRKKQMPFFRCLKREIFEGNELDDEAIASLIDLTQKLFLEIERELNLTGFWESISAKNKLKSQIQKVLLAPEFTKLPRIIGNRNQIINKMMELAEKNNDTILYAE